MILGTLDNKQTKCHICEKKFEYKIHLARHVGETHRWALKLYEKDVSKGEVHNKKTPPTSRLTAEVIVRSERKLRRTMSSDKTDISRPRRLNVSSKYLLASNGILSSKKVIVVVVMNDSPFIKDIDVHNVINKVQEDRSVDTNMDEPNPFILKIPRKPLTHESPFHTSVSTRYLVHGRNNMAWQMNNEEYSPRVLDWVKTRRFKNFMDFENLTKDEKSFFYLWNQFLLDKGYVGWMGRIHMESVLDSFVEELGGQVVEGRLYKQFVLHLVQMERENVLSQGKMLRLVTKLQQFGQGWNMDKLDRV